MTGKNPFLGANCPHRREIYRTASWAVKRMKGERAQSPVKRANLPAGPERMAGVESPPRPGEFPPRIVQFRMLEISLFII